MVNMCLLSPYPVFLCTHNTVWGLKLTLMFCSNLHYLLSCPRHMYLKMPKTVHPNTRNTIHSLKHCINVSNLADSPVSWGPWVLWVYSSTCTLAAFCCELLSSYNLLPFKIRWILLKSYLPFPYIFKNENDQSNCKRFSHHVSKSLSSCLLTCIEKIILTLSLEISIVVTLKCHERCKGVFLCTPNSWL